MLHAQEHPTQVDGEDPVPLVLGEPGQGLDRLLDTGVVEGDVHTAELLDRPVQRGLHLLEPTDVARQGEYTAAGVLDQPCRLPHGLLRDVGDPPAGITGKSPGQYGRAS